jgi:putative restriction endonuclease
MFAVALTDNRLLENLRTSAIGAAVNFWTPTPWNVRGLQRGNRPIGRIFVFSDENHR